MALLPQFLEELRRRAFAASAASDWAPALGEAVGNCACAETTISNERTEEGFQPADVVEPGEHPAGN